MFILQTRKDTWLKDLLRFYRRVSDKPRSVSLQNHPVVSKELGIL